MIEQLPSTYFDFIRRAYAQKKLLPEELFAVPLALVDAIVSKLPQLDLPVRSFVFPTFCVREMTIPAGSLVVARRYKVDHACICSAGEATVWGDGVQPKVITAPFTYKAEAGVQRVGYFHEPTVWTTIMPNPEGLTDPEACLEFASEAPPLPEAYAGLSLEELLALTPVAARAVLSEGVVP